jgi:Tfp pilus assembly protein PilF
MIIFTKLITLDEFKKAKDLSSQLKNSSEIYINIGFCYNQSDEKDKAITWLKEALKYNPKYANSYSTLAKIYTHLGNFKNAQKIMEEAV